MPNLKIVLASLFLMLLSSNSMVAQVNAYGFTQSLSGYTPLTTPTVLFPAAWDNGSATINFTPFTSTAGSFNFDGADYTSCKVSTNGFITFGTAAIVATTGTPLSDATSYSGVAAALGFDLASNGTDVISYGFIGASPNQTLVIQWTNAVRKGNVGTYNFQIRLTESTNVIQFSYGSCSTTLATPKPVQVGLRGDNNLFAQGNVQNRLLGSVSANTPWLNNTNAGTANNSTVVTSNLAYPDLGLLYTWTPAPACVTPTAQPTNLLLGATSISNTAFVGNSFTASSPAASNYLVLRSTINVPPNATQVPDGIYGVVAGTMGSAYTVVSVSSATTFTQTALVPDTTYYYWIIPYSNLCTGAPFYNLTNILTGSAKTCSDPTITTAATNVAGNSFDANWNPVVGATNYRIDVATDAAFASILPAYNNLSVGDVSTFSVTGVASVTTYYYRVRAIGASCAINSNTTSLTTNCGSYPIPYAQNFDTTGINLVPACYTVVNANADASVWSVQSVTAASAPRSIFIPKNSTLAMDDWFFMPGLNLTGGVTYRLFFRYNTGNIGSTTENLRVQMGSSPTVAGMTQTLLDLSNINNNIFKPVFVDFTPVITGVYFIGYDGFSAANQTYIAIDDISVTLSPTCFEPTDVVASSIGINTATVSWTPPVPDPANGYQYYLSTSATPPIATTTPTGSVGFGVNSVNLTGLTASTSYYIWVRGNCGATDKSIWSLEESFSTECITPVVTGSTPASRCGYGSVTLSATPNPTSVINWYANPTGGTLLFTGNNFVTPPLSATTTYYAEAKAVGAVAKVGPLSPILQGGTVGIQNFPSSLNFTITDATTLQAVDIFPIASGQSGTFIVRNSANIAQAAAIPFTTSVSGGTTLQSIPINVALAPGTYNLYLSVCPNSGLSMNTSGTFYPYTSSVANITGNPIDNTQYLGFYNWKFLTQCLSGRIPVIATVASPPSLTISSTNSVICAGLSTPTITIGGAGSYNTFTWSPSTFVSGNAASGYTFNPPITTTYTLTASQTSGALCSTVLSHTVTVNANPPAVSLLPATNITQCQNSIQALNGSVGASSLVPVLTESFNGATNNWVAANTSVDGDTNASQFTLRQSTYVYSSSNWNVSVKSNDNSKFYFANADSQGSSIQNTLTRTTLTSPEFSLAGYTSATLNFYHYLRFVGDAQFLVQISTNNGATWTTVKQYLASQPAATNFAYATIDLVAYLGAPAIKLRFNYMTEWNDGYGWAIDNVAISGTIATALSWSPAVGLYTDIAATIPYTAGNVISVVYANPAITTTYVATATGSNTCTSTGQITISVDPLPVGGTLSGSQALCNAVIPTAITLSGSTGNVIRWEYADDAAFTINVTPIANTTTTLLPAQMGVITTIRYFRAVVKSGVCTPVYSDVVSVSFPTTTWTTSWSNGNPTSGVRAIFNGNYTSTGNISACSVQILSGTVTFNSGHSLIVDNEVTVSSGSLIFETTASLVQYNPASVNVGNITYKRNTTPMKKYDYTYWSSPVAGQTLGAFSPTSNPDTFYQWGTAVNNWTFVPSTTTMQKAKGYIVRAPDVAPFNTATANVWNASFNGVPNSGAITIPLLLNSTDSLNLLGNPYPSAISADLFLSDPANISIMNGTIYLWTHNTAIANNVYTNNDYAIYNFMGGVASAAPAVSSGVNNNTPTGNIAAGESFFIEALAATNATFKNSMRLIGVNNQFFRQDNQLSVALSTPTEKSRIWLDLTNSQGAFKQMLLGYATDATVGYDRNYDGSYVDGGNVVGIYSINGDKNYSIQGLPLPFSTDDAVPLGFTSTISSEFDISLSQFDGLFDNQNVYLEDKYLNIVHDLKANSYHFSTSAGTFDNRFVLRYNTNALATPHFTISDLVIYNSDSKWIVNSGNTDMASLKVFDIRGRLLFENKTINANETNFYVGETNEVLLVQITSSTGSIVTKKVVN